MKTLSDNAQKLYNVIKSGSIWEDNAITILFPKPIYSKETAAEFWQYEANMYGNQTNKFPVNGVLIEFKINIPTCYKDISMQAITELKNEGLIYAKNNGYNSYSYHATN
jgi:hypothetical protein